MKGEGEVKASFTHYETQGEMVIRTPWVIGWGRDEKKEWFPKKQQCHTSLAPVYDYKVGGEENNPPLVT